MEKPTFLRKDPSDLRHRGARSAFKTMMGTLLAVTGFFWFAKKIGWIPVAASASNLFWPAVMIVLGVSILLASRHRRTNQAG